MKILSAAKFIQFGELFNVDIEDGARNDIPFLTDAQTAFINLLRDRGVQFAHTILVHNGVPVQVEINGEHQGIKYRQKIRVA